MSRRIRPVLPAVTAVMLLGTGAAHAGFSLEGSPMVSSERTPSAQFQPYEQRGNASFRQPTAGYEAKQARYQDAELMVDLAYRPVTQTGSGPADVVPGFADDVPFNAAMSMILPDGWQLYRGKSLGKSEVPETVSYRGGVRWPEILNQLGERYALAFHIDWNQRTVMLNKGRESAVSAASRIKIIPEPPRPVEKAPVPRTASSAPSSAAPATAAVATAVPAAKPISAAAPGQHALVPTTALAKQPVPTIAPAVTPKAVPPAAPPAVKAPAPAGPQLVTLQVRKGSLQENIRRLSAEHGWEAPAWNINADYMLGSNFTLTGKTFEEAISKLLIIHPIEANVNVGEHKIYVLKESQ